MDVMMRRRELMGMQGVLKTVSGPIVTVNDALARNAKSLVVNFAPIQAAGTPSPDNVLPISGWTGVTGYRTGVNLFDSTLFDTPTSPTNYVEYTSYQVPNGTYTMSTPDFPFYNNVTNVFFLPGAVNSGVSSATNGVSATNSRTITVTDGYYTVAYRTTSDVNTLDPSGYNWQINLGTSTTPYASYTGASYPVTFPAVGKNLLDQTQFDTQKSAKYLYIQLEVGQTYTISTNYPLTTVVINRNNTNLSAAIVVYKDHPRTFTMTGTGILGIRYYNSSSGAAINTYDWQLEKGSTATTYEPYTNTIYGGYVDLVSGVLVVDRVSNTAKWGTFTEKVNLGSYTRGHMTLSHPPKDLNSKDICNIAPFGGAWTGDFLHFFCNNTYSYGYVYLPNETDENTDIQFCYELSTPITYQLTPQTIAMLKGTNNVWSNANGNIELTYYAQ